MDPDQTWQEMLQAYTTNDWPTALESSESLKDWLEAGGFAPRSTIGTATGELSFRLDSEFSRAVCLAACHHIFEWSILKIEGQ